jgi:adenine-specific DNA-methyltransferase
LYADNSGQARSEQDVLYELILKSGLPLSCKVAPVTVAGTAAWSVDDNNLLILLNQSASREVLRAMIALQPQQLLCLDTAFNGDDALKTSIVLEARAHGITFRTV